MNIGDDAQRRFGWKLYTAMRYLPSGEVERVHTSNPQAYPLAGRKPRRDTPWSRQVLVRGEPYYANEEAGIRATFEDAEKILGLGLGAVINVPVKEGDRVLITKYGGTETKIDNKEYKVLSKDDILAVVE